MTHQFHLSLKSTNDKTGPIPVSTTSENSCPLSCPLMKRDGKTNGCYADNHGINFHWKKVSAGERGGNLAQFAEDVATLPTGQIWRHNQAGDLPGDRKLIDQKSLRVIVRANTGKRGFTYTHYDPSLKSNAAAIASANNNGFTINLSANTLAQADRYASMNIAPVTVLLPETFKGQTTKTPAGRTVTVCPAQTRDNVTCESCGLCSRRERNIVGFVAHGSQKAKVTLVAISGLK